MIETTRKMQNCFLEFYQEVNIFYKKKMRADILYLEIEFN